MLNKSKNFSVRIICTALLSLSAQIIFAQENSPYSRYGLGDLVPNTNIVNRGMGGISAGYVDILSINYNNPASYSNFQTRIEGGKVMSGRVLLDVGLNYDSRTLSAPNQPESFSSSYGYFSHVQLGIPLSKNWGMSFGLRPLSRINYKINRLEELRDPLTGNKIDSALTEFSGNGGTFLPNIGTGFAIKNFSIGVSMSYLFGKKEFSTKRSLYNGTTAYASSNHATRTYFGDLLFNAGAQYKIILNKETGKQTALNLGISGNWQQNISASRDLIRETFGRDVNSGDVRIDSVHEELDEEGEVVYPGSYTAGFVIDHTESQGNGWLLGVDYTTSQWDDYRFFGEKDDVKNNWKLRVGGQIRPTPSRNYWSNVAYRAGFFVGPDYINVGKQLPQFGLTFGLGLPIAAPRSNPGQFTIVNLGLEYSRRGNDDNILRENLFRASVGLNFSDLWFNKRRYD
jgi:hypothetical protein